MQIAFQTIFLKKRFPLRISRGVFTGGDNLFVSVTRDGITGWGEMAPNASEGADSVEAGKAMLSAFVVDELEGMSVTEIYDKALEADIAPCALAALDMALWDWLAKKAKLPLYQLLGIRKPVVPTSVTIGINPPEVIRERIPLLLKDTGLRNLKVKLGSPEGLDADKAMFSEVVEAAGKYPVKIRVDANGGWNIAGAIQMMKWLADRGCDYVEQPLPEGMESGLPEVYKNRALPVFVDESCRFASDIPAYAHAVDGVNMKLMKCGGITGALRIIATAKAFGLKTMIGCMGESSLSISAGAAITGMLDHVDLDSHLNLDPDPCVGATLNHGIITPPEKPGHGGYIKKNDR